MEKDEEVCTRGVAGPMAPQPSVSLECSNRMIDLTLCMLYDRMVEMLMQENATSLSRNALVFQVQ